MHSYLKLTFNQQNFHQFCDAVAAQDVDLKGIINWFGYPPFWSRPNTFESIVHIILEQQVSLASALATLNKLKDRIINITPENFLSLSDEELKDCYFSRQKTSYVRDLAQNLLRKTLDLDALVNETDEEIRTELTKIKGIGNWTVDIYLIFILHRLDVFPMGDLAAVNALKKVKGLGKTSSQEEIISTTLHWKPYSSLATMLLWHFYLEERKR
ncbi:DNA-3-methyladenine glycosylase family protein [Pedobacter jejuensis]|uniref:DNA-3-methyladenine glycosylase II n=1 Tax=Pedobacter jejuensis TaxID=1268550 RepID=A0A3N0C2N3_9SPHI|nr:DNA-3-methyladenine glycosylase [Pedobacter jejuensis]RNL56684.1 DNA-3-methyladenine glycosylase 2 family protein [Pedobacter jejuensis]